jgi:hypothetical protein
MLQDFCELLQAKTARRAGGVPPAASSWDFNLLGTLLIHHFVTPSTDRGQLMDVRRPPDVKYRNFGPACGPPSGGRRALSTTEFPLSVLRCCRKVLVTRRNFATFSPSGEIRLCNGCPIDAARSVYCVCVRTVGSQKREPNPPTGVKTKHKGWDTFLTSQRRDKKRRDGTDKRREIARTRRVGASF